MRRIGELPDGELVALYSEWSEERYCAGFMHPSEETVKEFREELPDIIAKKMSTAFKWYERQFLIEYKRQTLEAKNYDTGQY
jgi:hypothetical protein